MRKRYGVGPELVPDFIALRGDPSDGLPGAKGIGPKTAAELLQRYGSLEGAIERRRRSRGRCARGWARRCATRPTSCARSWRSRSCARSTSTLPPDAPLPAEQAAAAARELGMNRLAERVEKLGDG